jgi:hypothetical protein
MVLKATQEQYNELNGFTYGVSILEFIKDKNNQWVIGEEVINNDDFLSIKDKLLNLTVIEFIPPIIMSENPI